MPDWLVYLIEEWTFEFFFGIFVLVVLFLLPTGAWLLLFEKPQKPDKERKP